jgi:hypothetical protein
MRRVLLVAAILALGAAAPAVREMGYGRDGAGLSLRVWSGADGKPGSVIVERTADAKAPAHDADIAAAPWDLIDLKPWVAPGEMAEGKVVNGYRVVLEDGEGGREITQRSGDWTVIRTYGKDGLAEEKLDNAKAEVKAWIRPDKLSILRVGPQLAAFEMVKPAKAPDGAESATILKERCAWGSSQTTYDSTVLTCTTADGIVLARQDIDAYGGGPVLKAVELKRGPQPLSQVLPSRERLAAFIWRAP